MKTTIMKLTYRLFALAVFLIGLGALLRPIGVMIDFGYYYNTAVFIKNGINPYDTLLYSNGLPPVVAPQQAILFIPVTFLSIDIGKTLFYVVNIGAIVFLFFLLIRLFRIELDTVSFVICSFLLLLTAPANAVLQHGQISAIASALILTSLTSIHPLWRGFFLALGVALKLSFLPLAGIALFAPNKAKIITFASVIFCILLIIPAFFYSSLLSLYSDYTKAIALTMGKFDGYAFDGARDRMDFGFINSTWITGLFVLGGMLSFLYIWWKGRREFSANALLYWLCLSVSVGYHRQHDLIAVQALMLVFIISLYRDREYIPAYVLGLFFAFFCLPKNRVVYPISEFLATLVGPNSLIQVGMYDKTPLFPLYGVMMFFLTLYAGYLYFFTKRSKELLLVDSSLRRSPTRL